jgi:dihydrofolate reductase
LPKSVTFNPSDGIAMSFGTVVRQYLQGDDAVRKVVAGGFLSLDGVAEQPDEFVTEWDEAVDENIGRVIATQDTVLLGRGTYDEWSAFWPNSNIEPFATFINGVEKFVASSTTPGMTWSNTSVIDGGLSEFVTELKRQPGDDIGVHESIALTQSLLEAGLVDELWLCVAPVLHMHGRKLFDKGLPRKLVLTRHVATPAGYLLLDFQVGSGVEGGRSSS